VVSIDSLAGSGLDDGFRVAGIADIPAVARMARLSFDPHYREAWNEAQMAAVVAGKGGFLLARFEMAGQPVAFALCRQVVDEVELLLCATHPQHRRKGLGRDVIRAVVAESHGRGARRLFLEVRSSNAGARALYAACGMVEQGIRKAYYRTITGEPLDAITLGLALSS